MRDGQQVNAFGTPAGAPRGVQEIIYSHAFVALGAGEAMVVEVEPDDAPLWDIQLYNRVWYEPLDFAHRVTGLNHRQVRGSGPVRVVIAGTDPGVANWLDTEGRDEVLATIRWWRPTSGPTVRSWLTTLDALPAGLDVLDRDGRRDQVAARTAHVGWRFRT